MVCVHAKTISREPKLYPYENPQELLTKAEEYLNRNVNDSALLCFTAVIGQFPDKVPSEYRSTVITALNGIGLIHFMNGNYSEAYTNFAQSINIDERADSPGYINIAGLFHYYGDEDRSVEYLRKGFEAASTHNNQYYLCLSFINLVNSAIATGNFTNLKDLTVRFRSDLKEKTTPESLYALKLADAADVAVSGNYLEAVKYLKVIPKVLDGFFLQDRALFDTNANIGRLFQQGNMNDSAMYYMKKAEQYAISQRQPDMIVEITKNLAALCKANGDKEGWEKYRYRWLELQDSLFYIKGMNEVHNLEMGYEAQRYGKEIEHLTIEKNFRMKLIIISAIGIFVLLVLLLIVLNYNKKLVTKNHDLFQKNLDILELKRNGTETHNVKDERESEYKVNSKESKIADSGLPETNQNIPTNSGDDSCKNGYALSENYMEDLWHRIQSVMEREEVFCNQEFSMQKLSEILNTNTKYISQTINWKTGQNFTSYLSEKRMDVACSRFIDNDTYGQLTLEAIITDVGYKSRSSFIKTFKRYTGLTPSEYRKIAIEKSGAHKD
ncbi:MAG: AraC family transcriptional regulator [Muribaculaceae bacterium]|nr:AraC family transcriptional regulator [Muribaculaceae bacterium]